MKKIFSMVLATLFCASIAFGAVGIKVNNVHQGTASDINFPTGTTVTTSDGSTFTVSPVVGAVAAVTSGTISGVTINNSTIGATTPSTAVFTTASATNLSATNMNSTAIGATTPSTAVFTTLRATSGLDSTAIGATTPSTAVFTTCSATALSATNMNSTAIGATTPSTAVFTTCTTTGRFIKDVAALTPGATVTVDASLADVFTLVPDQTGNIVASNVTPGQNVTLVITTSGTTAYTLTFATGFTTTGTLSTGSSDAKVFVMDFISTGTTLKEKSRTTAM